jgi:ribosomal protein S18 acetylase RimI-like enzyme
MIEVRPLLEEERDWAVAFEAGRWGGTTVIARAGELIDSSLLPALVATLDGERAGLLTYLVRDDQCEIVTLASAVEGRGVGQALLGAVKEIAERAGCRRLWLITTNDNLRALKFYQRWGMDLVALHHNAVNYSREHLKPEIPERDDLGIPIAHELELELRLSEPR